MFGNDFPAVKRDQPRYEGEVLVKAMGLGKGWFLFFLFNWI